MKHQYRILFICLGNICRSCAAQTVMQKLVDDAGLSDRFYIDSAGLIDYHEGDEADPRMRTHARRRGYNITHRSRPLRESDFDHFDYIIGMDGQNIKRLHRLAPTAEAERKISLMSDYCVRQSADCVPDPYYGGSAGFEHVLDLLEDACDGLLQALTRL